MPPPGSLQTTAPGFTRLPSHGMVRGIPPPSLQPSTAPGFAQTASQGTPPSSFVPNRDRLAENISEPILPTIPELPALSPETSSGVLPIISSETTQETNLNQPASSQLRTNQRNAVLSVVPNEESSSGHGLPPGLLQTMTPGLTPVMTRSLSTGLSPEASSSLTTDLISNVNQEYVPGAIHRISEGIPLSSTQRPAPPVPNFGVIGDRSRHISRPVAQPITLQSSFPEESRTVSPTTIKDGEQPGLEENRNETLMPIENDSILQQPSEYSGKKQGQLRKEPEDRETTSDLEQSAFKTENRKVNKNRLGKKFKFVCNYSKIIEMHNKGIDFIFFITKI